jgi:hypothetical protein
VTRMLLLAALLAAILAASASGAPKQRWEACGARALCATADGGKHWRKVFELPAAVAAPGTKILGFLRWSASAGAVSVDLSTPESDTHSEFWTRDGGAHWWRTDVFDVGLGGTCTSAGELRSCIHRIRFIHGVASDAPAFFFDVAGQIGTDPFQGTYYLKGWVPRRQPSCTGKWLGSPGRQICWGPVVNAGMSASPR